jgi:phage gp29-like protein
MRIDLIGRIKTFFQEGEQARKAELAGEFASRGRSIDSYLDILGALPDPDPVLKKLDATGTILNDLMSDEHVTSVVQTRKVGTLNREWRIEPGGHGGADPDALSKRACDEFAADLDNLNMFDVISQILDAPYYGMAPIEIIYASHDGFWHIGELRCLPAAWFRFAAADNQPKFLSLNDMIAGEPLPENKFVFARHFPSYKNPYGLRLLSRCFWPVTFKKGGVTFWMKFLEKFGIPHVVGKYKEGTTKAVQAEILANLASMVQDAVAVIPEGTAIDVLNASGGKSSGSDGSFSALKDAMEAGISKVIMGQTLTAEIGDKGSFAASKTHENVLESYRECDARLVKDAIEQVAWIYCQVNFPGAANPRFVWHEEDDPRKDFADRDKVLHETGVRFRKSYYTRFYGLREDEFDIAEAAAASPDNSGMFAEGDKLDDDQLLLEKLMADVIPDGTVAAGETIKQIMAAVDAADGYDDLSERLAKLFPTLDGERFRQVLERALFASEMFGMHTASIDDKNASGATEEIDGW